MIYAFGDCELDEELYELRRGGLPVKLEPKVFKVLVYLIQHRDHVVRKDELLEKLWPGEFVTESALIRSIVKARQAVHDDGTAQRLIKTVHGQGYRFVAAVEILKDAAEDVPSVARKTDHEEINRWLSPPSHPTNQSLTSRHTREGERKQITILSVGLKGIVALAQATDPERLNEVLNRIDELTRAEVQRFGGIVSQSSGGRLTALFGTPVAYEDHSVRALHAALELQRSFAPVAHDLLSTHGISLTLRLGLHSDSVLVSTVAHEGRSEYGVQGFAAYLANSLHELAPDGGIYVSEAIRQQAAGFFRFDDLGELALPEIARPVRVYACRGMDQATSRLEVFLRRHTSAFLGREREMDLLSSLWAAVRNGQGQVICLFGEAGVGKSRIAHEFPRTLIEARRLQVQALSYRQAMPYHVFIPLLRSLLRLSTSDPPPEQRQQIRARLHTLHPQLADDEPLLSHLIGVPLDPDQLPNLAPETQKRRLQNICLQLIAQQAVDRPLCLIIEDLHWLDHSSQEVLDLLVTASARQPILLLGTTRPGFHHTWDDLTYFHRLTVGPLPDEHVDAIIRDYFQPDDASATLKTAIRERAVGNPFFVEEILRALRERELITLQGGVYVLKTEAELDIPSSVHGVLAARIDRLPPEAKHLLQTASAIGMDVPAALLQNLAALPADALRRALDHLQGAEFLYETRLLPDLTYTFKHALTRQVAYETLLPQRRRTLHAHIVEILPGVMADRLADQVGQLAYHALRGEVWEKAVTYCQYAGAQAAARSAHREAAAYFEQALGALQHLPEEQGTRQLAVDLRIELRNSLHPLGRFEPILGYLREAESFAEILDDRPRLARVSSMLANSFLVIGDPDRALVAGSRALATAGEDVALQVLANFFLGMAYHALGDYPRAMEHCRRNIASREAERRYERFGLYLLSVSSRTFLVWCLAERGMFAQGIALAEEAVRIAEAADHHYSCIQAYYGVGLLYIRKGEPHKAIPTLERALQLCHVWDIPIWLPWTGSALGKAYVLAGRLSEGLPLLTQAVERATAMGLMVYQSLLHAWLSEAHLVARSQREALMRARQALDLARAHKERGHEAWVHHLLGEIMCHHKPLNTEQAAEHYHQALTRAMALGMRPLLAHCHLGLGTLYTKIGRREQARAELSAAIELFHAMQMTFWLTRAETLLAQGL